jgi:CheY-like chemotaxis protein/DNA-directed RNA polymerase specialized sigma24 family protein
MSLGAQLAPHLPYVRRYARALCGDQPAGDTLVVTLLEAALDQPELRARLKGGRIALYRALGQLWRDISAGEATALPKGAAEKAAQLRLSRITPLSRQALLLTTVEDFTTEQAAEILGTTVLEVRALVASALADIARDTAADVMIIEDEPLIAMQLEDIVRAQGHRVCATAATRTQAVQAIATCRPGLVLADIQLADGSSGIDAVEDIQALIDVPVIFITAYPERLLTGTKVEPTWLITKPFREASVVAAMAQALFFREPASLPGASG